MKTLFQSNKQIIKSEQDQLLKKEKKECPFTAKEYEEHIIKEEYLWDMRCWEKPKSEYSKSEIKKQIKKWIKDDKNNLWTCNCGHVIHCINQLLKFNWATLDEIVDLFIKNENIKTGKFNSFNK
ncbi:MAG: hypothetical protein U9R08_02825 [Nanoarchaeota archaeon]|nr:hypothetical protein [Nanoarchaeota archaeon]